MPRSTVCRPRFVTASSFRMCEDGLTPTLEGAGQRSESDECGGSRSKLAQSMTLAQASMRRRPAYVRPRTNRAEAHALLPPAIRDRPPPVVLLQHDEQFHYPLVHFSHCAALRMAEARSPRPGGP